MKKFRELVLLRFFKSYFVKNLGMIGGLFSWIGLVWLCDKIKSCLINYYD